MTENIDDIMAVLRPLIERPEMLANERVFNRPTAEAPAYDTAVEQEIIDLLGPVPVTVDELIRLSAAPVQQVHLVLLQLELSGRLTTEPGGKISLI